MRDRLITTRTPLAPERDLILKTVLSITGITDLHSLHEQLDVETSCGSPTHDRAASRDRRRDQTIEQVEEGDQRRVPFEATLPKVGAVTVACPFLCSPYNQRLATPKGSAPIADCCAASQQGRWPFCLAGAGLDWCSGPALTSQAYYQDCRGHPPAPGEAMAVWWVVAC